MELFVGSDVEAGDDDTKDNNDDGADHHDAPMDDEILHRLFVVRHTLVWKTCYILNLFSRVVVKFDHSQKIFWFSKFEVFTKNANTSIRRLVV